MKKNKKAVIYGTGLIAEVVWYYLTHDSPYEVLGFVNDSPSRTLLFNLPVCSTKDMERAYMPKEIEVFIAIGYSQMNELRERSMKITKKKGYKLLNYVSSNSSIFTDLDLEQKENLFILEDNTIQPFVTIGNGVFLWSGNYIGHHSQIKDYNFISSHVVISGSCVIESHSFLGVNSTIIDGITIGSKSLIGARALIKKNTEPESVYYAEPSAKSTKNSSFFMK